MVRMAENFTLRQAEVPPLRDGHAAAALQVEPAGPAASQAGFEPLRPYEEFLAPPEVPDEPAQN